MSPRLSRSYPDWSTRIRTLRPPLAPQLSRQVAGQRAGEAGPDGGAAQAARHVAPGGLPQAAGDPGRKQAAHVMPLRGGALGRAVEGRERGFPPSLVKAAAQ